MNVFKNKKKRWQNKKRKKPALNKKRFFYIYAKYRILLKVWQNVVIQSWTELADIFHFFSYISIIIIIKRVLLKCRSRKTSRTLTQYINQRYKKTGAPQIRYGELGKGNSEKMCLQPAPEGAECLWRSDAGWQAVPDARISDEEGPVTNRRTTRWRRYESRRWYRPRPTRNLNKV